MTQLILHLDKTKWVGAFIILRWWLCPISHHFLDLWSSFLNQLWYQNVIWSKSYAYLMLYAANFDLYVNIIYDMIQKLSIPYVMFALDLPNYLRIKGEWHTTSIFFLILSTLEVERESLSIFTYLFIKKLLLLEGYDTQHLQPIIIFGSSYFTPFNLSSTLVNNIFLFQNRWVEPKHLFSARFLQSRHLLSYW